MDPGSSYLNLQGEPVVSLYVGNDREVFYIHRNLLCNASPVFEAALAGEFKESSDLSMELPDDDVGSLNRLVQWLYTKRYEVDDYESKSYAVARCWQLARLNALADKYDIFTLRDDIVDKFFATFSPRKAAHVPYPSIELAEYVYTNSSKHCALRDLLAAVYCWKVPHSWYSRVAVKDKLNSIPAFGVDIAIAMARKFSGKGDPFRGKTFNCYVIACYEDSTEDEGDSSVQLFTGASKLNRGHN